MSPLLFRETGARENRKKTLLEKEISKNVITYLLSEAELGAGMLALNHLSCSETGVPEEPQG